ncbi:MAG: hypothetical protein HQL52_12525 [Magnetococcales bacterium]|nr:hypothetical protein [Magnetococcales bacterium]
MAAWFKREGMNLDKRMTTPTKGWELLFPKDLSTGFLGKKPAPWINGEKNGKGSLPGSLGHVKLVHIHQDQILTMNLGLTKTNLLIIK